MFLWSEPVWTNKTVGSDESENGARNKETKKNGVALRCLIVGFRVLCAPVGQAGEVVDCREGDHSRIEIKLMHHLISPTNAAILCYENMLLARLS